MFMGASCIGAVNSIYYIYSQEQLNQIGLSILSISILYFATSLLCALLSMRVHIFEEKFTKKNMIITASAASAVCYLCMCFRMPFLTSFCFIILNILFNILETVFFGVINPELPSEQRASLLSTLSLVTAVIMTALSLGLGYLAKEIDLSILLGMLGLLLMMAGLVFIFQYFQFLKRQEKRSINS